MESHEVRHCVLKYQTLGEHVLEVAKVIGESLRKHAKLLAHV